MKLKYLITTAAIPFLMTACLKDKDKFGLEGDKGSIVSEIYDVNLYGDLKVMSLNAAPATETVGLITLKFYAARDAQPAGDVTLHLTRKDALATAQGLTIPPANAITLGSLDVVIPKGAKEVDLPITLNKANLNLSLQYGLGFEASTVSEGVISENAKTIVVAILIKNAYDANYTSTGYFFHPTTGSSRALGPVTKHLATLGAATCQAALADLAGYYFNFDVSGTNTQSWVGVGSAPAAPASGFYTADNPGAVSYDPALGVAPGTAPYVQTTYNNSYNAATKTFYFHYGYGVGAANQNGWTRNVYEKWVRQ